MFPDTIRTDRLLLEKVCRENVDVYNLYDIRSNDDGIADVAEYLPWEPHTTPKETMELLKRAEREWDDCQAARYVLRPTESEPHSGELAGYAKLDIDWDRNTGSLGIWLRKKFWGREYATERAEALLSVAFDQLELALVEITHQDGNEKSRRSVQKCIDTYGGQYEGLLRNWTQTTDGVVDEHRYTISAAEYDESIGKQQQ